MEELTAEDKLNPILFNVQIEKYQELAASDLLVVYTIRVTHSETNSWKIERSFNEFETLHKTFVKLYKEVPILPNRSLFSMSEREKNLRMQQLESYIMVNKH